MKNTKNKLVLNSLIILPMFASLTGSPVSMLSVATGTDSFGIKVTEEAVSPEEALRLEKAEKIDAYFAAIDSPLEGYGMKFVLEAEKNNLPWTLGPAVAMRESTAGLHPCSDGVNVFGWGSCKIKFESYDQAIETVLRNLGGNNPRTASYYKGKSVDGILNAYNPPSVIPKYTSQVKAIMATIEHYEA